MSRTNEVELHIGKKGSGKTTRVRERLLAAPRRIIIDPMHEYGEGVIITEFDALATYLDTMANAARYSVVFRTMDDDERDDVISLAVAGTPERPPLPGLLLVIDEIDRICTPHNIPDGLRRVINYGRHYGVSVLAACRRPRAMHRDVTANADRIVIGQTQEPGDLDYLREFIGENLARRAARLARFECVTWPEDLEGGDAVDTGGTGVAQGTGAPTGEPEAEGPGVGMAGVRDAPSAPPGDSADDGGAGLSGGAQSPPGSAGRS